MDAIELPDEARALARQLLELQRKLFALPQHLDESWLPRLVARWPFLAACADARLQGRVLAAVVLRDCGGMPRVEQLGKPQTQLALLDRAAIVRSLCVLAIARRPGVLRCCIDRATRDALLGVLGPQNEALLRQGGAGRSINSEAALWSPLHWACLGFFDWAGVLRREDRLCRRIVSMSLPAHLLAMHERRRETRGDVPVVTALETMTKAGWPC